MSNYDFSIIGGDKRLVYMAEFFIEKGFSVISYSPCLPQEIFPEADSLETALSSSNAVICPIPFSRDKKNILSLNNLDSTKDLSISTLKDSLNPHHLLFAGCIPLELMAYGEESGIFMYDYMLNEELTLYNTIATAEGAIAEAIKYQPTNMHESKCLILGFGRCAKTLALKLKGLAADVTICARSITALAEADTLGCKTMSFDTLEADINSFEYIFNTIPQMVLSDSHLKKISKDSLLIDIAPGGFDFELSRSLGLNSHLSLGLPGKYSPKSSALVLANATLAICSAVTNSSPNE